MIVIVKLTGVPTQDPTDGVTVIVPEIGVEPPFVPVKVVMLPVPFAARPIAGFVFVQLKVAPIGLLTNAAGETFPPH